MDDGNISHSKLILSYPMDNFIWVRKPHQNDSNSLAFIVEATTYDDPLYGLNDIGRISFQVRFQRSSEIFIVEV